MRRRMYLIIRDLHLYLGLFLAPFVLVFSFSVFFLVHPSGTKPPARTRTVANLEIPDGIESLGGRARVEAVRKVIDQAGLHGEIGFVRHIVKERKLVSPVSVPGRDAMIEIDLASRSAVVSERDAGLADALIMLHKLPGPHLVEIRMNWPPMRPWRRLADGTVYVTLFLTASGIYLWLALRAERRIGLALLAFGAVTFFGMVYALV
jgi:hypothetical protein